MKFTLSANNRSSTAHPLLRLALPAATLGLALVIWQVVVFALGIKPYLLPTPWAVAEAAFDEKAKLASAFLMTGKAAVCGLAFGVAAGVVIAFFFAQSRLIRACFYPYAIFLQTVPIVAIAPLLINWFGSGPQTVIVVSFIICLFPIITNVTAGLISVSPELRDLFRLQNASRLQTLFKLQLPHAIPHLVTGARISSGLAVIGAIVGEFFASFGSQATGLGYLMMIWQTQQKNALLISAVIASTLLGVAIFLTVGFVGDTLLRRWTRA